MQKTIVLLCLISLFVISCEARWRCTFSWKKSDPHCIRMNADAVQLRSTFGKCFSGANADFTGEGTFDFPANETLKAGDWQYRIYEDGVKDKVASSAGDLMKSLEIDGNKWKLNIPFVMPVKRSTGHFTVDFLAKDQDHVDDLCLAMAFNYSWFD